MEKACCGFGHRDIFENIDKELDEAICYAIEQGCSIFYTGAMGEFDYKFSLAVNRQKKLSTHIKLFCVKPYLTSDINKFPERYELYDEVFIPSGFENCHYKQIITKRNKWIIDNSDIAIFYVTRSFGGAFEALKYAKKNNKNIKML
ncbi:MAG: hypothetical protein K5917_05580 [Clostridiales bacterium]|nr:hypothetical protein [Clostridiales bacterium]